MNCIFLYDGPFEQGEKGWPMIRQAAARYGEEMGMVWDFYGAEIIREEKGKPYFVDIPVEFSLSHSGLLWMCLFSEQACGLDLQQVKSCRFAEIAGRQFTEEEQAYVAGNGLEGFFDVWVRKEAFGKCTGQGIFSQMPTVAAGGALLPQVSWQGKDYCFTEIEISPDIRCAVCAGEKLEIEMRILG